MKVITQQGLPLAFGQKIMLTLRGEKYQAVIRGWMEGQYLIVDNPQFQGDPVYIAPLTGCSLDYTVEGTYVNFKSLVLVSINQPVRLLVIEFPRQFDTFELRKNPRHQTNFPIVYIVEKEPPEEVYNGSIRDLSITGALICHERRLFKNQHIFITLELPEATMTNLEAEVMNVRKNPRSTSEPFVTGVFFPKMTPEQDSLLRKFLSGRAKDRRRKDRKSDLK